MINTVSEIFESMTFTLSVAFSVTLLNLVIFLYYSEEVKDFNKRNAKQKIFTWDVLFYKNMSKFETFLKRESIILE